MPSSQPSAPDNTAKPITILLIITSPTAHTRHLLEEVIHGPYELVYRTGIDRALADLQRDHTIDIIICEYSLNVTHHAILHQAAQALPIVQFTTSDDQATSPHLLKPPFDTTVLERTLRTAMSDKPQNKQYMHAIQASDDFISLASHHLRTPATIVKQYLSLLLDGYAGPNNAEQRAFLQHAYDNNERQLAAINKLLRILGKEIS